MNHYKWTEHQGVPAIVQCGFHANYRLMSLPECMVEGHSHTAIIHHEMIGHTDCEYHGCKECIEKKIEKQVNPVESHAVVVH